MTLGEMIRALEAVPSETVVPFGFNEPHSYRGYYDELAFEPCRDTTAGAMLECARSALGETFQGYKGGDYKMGEHTDCWLAHYGDVGETIGATLLTFMLGGKP